MSRKGGVQSHRGLPWQPLLFPLSVREVDSSFGRLLSISIDCATVAIGLILLLREFDRVRSLSATDTPLKQRGHVRDAAFLLIQSLEG